jgi:hypothetical protein
MGQFKPMVKMMTTEPTVELKLKKGGSVAHKKMKSGGTCASTGHKMMDGGMAPTVGTPMGGMAPTSAPAKPSMAARRAAMAKAMKGSRGMKPRATPPKGAKVVMPAMKDGGALSALKAHADKPASKAHKGLKTGGVVKGQGGYKTGGVVKGQGGYAEGGIIKSTTGKTKVVTATADNSPAKTGDVKLGNGGGYKKGGSTKKFAEGGSVQDDGRPQKMPQGNKKPSSPVSISKLSGTFKKGGKVASKKLQAVFKKENAPAMKAAKANSDLKYSKYQKMQKFADGGQVGLAGMPEKPISGNPELDAMASRIRSSGLLNDTTIGDTFESKKPNSSSLSNVMNGLGIMPKRTNPLPVRPTAPRPRDIGTGGGGRGMPIKGPRTIGMGGSGLPRDIGTGGGGMPNPMRGTGLGANVTGKPTAGGISTGTSPDYINKGVSKPGVMVGVNTPEQVKAFNAMNPAQRQAAVMKKGGKVKKYADGGYAGISKPTFDEGFASPSEQLAEMRKRKQMEEGYKGTRERETASNEALLDSLTSLPASVKAMVRKALRGSGAVTDTQTTVSRTVTPPAKKRGGKVRK